MFNNVMELIELIEKGISNEEIINERLKYLNSEEYRSKRKATKTITNEWGDETKAVLFHDGFIPKDMPIGLETDDSSNCYTINNINDLYEELLNYIRDNKETIKERKGIAIKYVGEIIKSYFMIPRKESDKEAIEIFKQAWINTIKRKFATGKTDAEINRQAQLQVRNQIGGILETWKDAVKANLFKGDFKDYMMIYLYNHQERDRLSNEISKWRENHQDGGEQDILKGATLDISEICGYNVAKCTEHAMVTQNALSFLGYESFMLEGKLKHNNESEGHNFNVVKKNGKYYIIDTVNRIYNKHIETMDDKEAEELICFGEYSTTFKTGETITYYSEEQISTREENSSSNEKSIQELGKETIHEFEDAKYLEETETTINEMQEELDNSQNK